LRGATGSGNVTVGQSAAGTTTLRGTTTVTTLDATTATSGLTLGNNSTSGAVTIANGSSFTGNIAIGAGSVSRTGTINIGTGGSGGITIGNATCSVALGPPLTLGSAPPGSTGLTSGQAPFLGSFYNPVLSTTLVGAGGGVQASIAIGTPGVYLLMFCLQIAYTTAPQFFYVTITGANIVNSVAFGTSSINNGNSSSQGSIVVSCTASTYNLVSNYVPGSGVNNAVQPASFFQAVRIG